MTINILHMIFVCMLVILTVCGLAQFKISNCTQLSFLPMPKNINCDIQANAHKIGNPCNVLYKIHNNNPDKQFTHFVQLIQHQQLKTFGCKISHIAIGKQVQYKQNRFKYIVQVIIIDPALKSAFTTQEQSYNITIQKNKVDIKANTYVGFVRALQTFMQSITCDKYKVQNCVIKNLPIIIQDQPAYKYRSLMIDSSRHYLPLSLIYETIDALMYNKMNILHWHIVDQDSFPLILNSHPQLAQYAAFSNDQMYTPEQIKEIVKYAMIRGVRIVPEIDTPGHAASWGKAPQNQKVACKFNNFGYMGPLDITLQQTYKLVKQVFTQIFQLFPDPFVHLGGDQVVLTCLKNITEFQRAYPGQNLQLVYRKRQRKMLKQVNPHKTFIYWMNSEIILQDNDIVHWWGGAIPETNHQVIISNFGPFYLDMGAGNYFGDTYGIYQTWLDLYRQDIHKNAKNITDPSKVIGADALLWSQSSNHYVHHLKIWIRTSSVAERTWSLLNQNQKPDFFRRITFHQRLMNRRGIPTSPATCETCQLNTDFCY